MREAIDDVIEQGLQAVEAEDLAGAEVALDTAQGIGGENHVRVLHLHGLISWAKGDLERAAGFLMQSVDLTPSRGEIYLDAAECLLALGQDLDEAEAVIRTLLAQSDIGADALDQGRLLLAQIRLEDDDAEEALEVLDDIRDELKVHPAYLSTRAMVLEAEGHTDQALAALRQAVVTEPDDPDLHYQLGLLLGLSGDAEASVASMVKVLELDNNDRDDDPQPPPALSDPERATLRGEFEELLEEIPERLLKLVAPVPVTVQARPTLDQVKAGVNPRSSVAFIGTPKRGDTEATLEGIVLMRDLLLEEAQTEDEDLQALLFVGLFEELRAFYKLENLEVVSAG